MMLFSDRKKAEDEFLKWCQQTGAAPVPSNVMAWLMGSGKHWLDKMTEDEIKIFAATDWGATGDPQKDIIAAKERLMLPETTPRVLVTTVNDRIKLEAIQIFCDWLRDWRKKHPILSFFEKVMNKIRGEKYG